MLTDTSNRKIEKGPNIAQLPIAIATFDQDFCFLSHSDVWLRTHHRSNSSLAGQALFDTLPSLPIKFKTIITNALNNGTNNQGEEKFQKPGGSSIWYSWNLNTWYKKDGTLGGTTLILNDYTYRLGYDELLNEAQEVSRTGGWQVNLVHFEVLWTKMVNIIHEKPLGVCSYNVRSLF